MLFPAALTAQTIDVHCAPALPHFCANIHVSCAGRTEQPTFPFRLRARGKLGAIEAAPAAIAAQYANARATWSEDGAVILRPREGPGYIKLQTDGRYSFRHYVGEAGIMSHGRCE